MISKIGARKAELQLTAISAKLRWNFVICRN